MVIPSRHRVWFLPIIGVSIGAAVTPDILLEARSWWPSLLALFLFIPVAHLCSFLTVRRIGLDDRMSALYGTMPGGFVEATEMGEAAGADVALISVMQLLRLIICIVMIPFGFTLLTGSAVGSAAGEVIGAGPLRTSDIMLMVAAGVAGALIARALKFPAWVLTGPLLLSGALHATGLVTGGPPRWMIELAQFAIGTSLGGRFAGRGPDVLGRGARYALVAVSLTLAIAGLFASILGGLVGERWEAVFLAYAPGGVVEMSLVALSLQVSVIYVTAHHIIRILLAVMLARFWASRMG